MELWEINFKKSFFSHNSLGNMFPGYLLLKIFLCPKG